MTEIERAKAFFADWRPKTDDSIREMMVAFAREVAAPLEAALKNREEIIKELDAKMKSALYEQQESWTKDYNAQVAKVASLAVERDELIMQQSEHAEQIASLEAAIRAKDEALDAIVVMTQDGYHPRIYRVASAARSAAAPKEN